MKKFLLTAAMSGLFFIGLTSMVNLNSADPYPDCAEDCAFLESIGIFENHGQCMSACHTCTSPNQGPYAVCICNLIDSFFGGLENAGFKNMGQCVSTVRHE